MSIPVGGLKLKRVKHWDYKFFKKHPRFFVELFLNENKSILDLVTGCFKPHL